MLVCAALFYACTPESGNDVPEDGTLIDVCLNAGIDGSKVALDETLLHPSWQEGDRLAVYDGSAIREFTLFSGAGSSQATFSGQISASASNLKAVYPYSAAKLEGSKLTYSVPAEQSVSAAGADPQALVMYSEGQLGSALHFSQCTSMLRFSAPEGVRNLVFRLDEGSVTMNLPGTAGNYAVAINPGSYSGLTLYIVADGGSYIMESSTPFDITTGLSVSLGELALDESCVIIKTPAELAAFLKSTSAGDKSRVLILNDIDMRGTSFEPASGFGGFLACFFVSLLYHFGWALAAVALLIVHFVKGYPLWFVFVGLGIWVVSALVSALIITFGNKNFAGPYVKQDNINPYSKSNSDFGMGEKK